MEQKYYSVGEAAKYLGLSKAYLNKLRCYNTQEQSPPFAKIGGRVLYPVKQLDEFIESRIVWK